MPVALASVRLVASSDCSSQWDCHWPACAEDLVCWRLSVPQRAWACL